MNKTWVQTRSHAVRYERIHKEEPGAAEPVSSSTRPEHQEHSAVEVDIPEVRWSTRKTEKPIWFKANQSEALQAEAAYPNTYLSAVNGVNGSEWRALGDRELEAFKPSGTCSSPKYLGEEDPWLEHVSSRREETHQKLLLNERRA